MNPYYIGIILVIASATGFAFMPIFTIYAYQDGVSTLSVLFLRFFFASLFFFIFIIARKIEFKLTYSLLFRMLMIGGFFYMIQSILYFSSVKYLSASMVQLLFYAYPALVAIFSFWLDREPLNKNLIIALLISFVGLALVLGTSFATINKLGAMFALSAALVYAMYILVSNRLVKEVSPMITSTFVTLFAAFSLFIVGLATNSISFEFPLRTWFPIMGIVLFSTVLAIFGLFKGLEIIGSTRAAILSMIEPLVTIIFAWILFNDQLTLIQWLGAILVISGAFLVTRAREKRSQPDSDNIVHHA